jgi:hypothetical protein
MAYLHTLLSSHLYARKEILLYYIVVFVKC